MDREHRLDGIIRFEGHTWEWVGLLPDERPHTWRNEGVTQGWCIRQVKWLCCEAEAWLVFHQLMPLVLRRDAACLSQ